MALDQDLIRRYLTVLGASRRTPSISALDELVAAHLTRIPFESISKLYYRKHLALTGLTPLELFLDGIELYRLGGTCYCNNFHFYTLLANLGYEVKLCAADMSNPDVHVVIMVTVEGREYLVDAGYAAPFLSPLPRDSAEDHVVALGRDRYVLKPQDAAGRSRLELHRDGVAKHGYVAKPEPKKIEDFVQVIADSFQPGATFLNAVLLARFYPHRSVVIHNLTLIESRGTEFAVRTLAGRAALIAAVEEHFGIPQAIAADAINEVPHLQDAWG